MDSAAQPILCCLGESVEGRATQFCVERVIDEYQLDWRVISAEVDADALPTAIAGLQAIGVRALRFFGELQTVAAEVLGPQASDIDSRNPDLPGNPGMTAPIPISSALRTPSGWQSWYSLAEALPIAIGEALESSQSARRPACDWTQLNWLLCGRSRFTLALESRLRSDIQGHTVSIADTSDAVRSVMQGLVAASQAESELPREEGGAEESSEVVEQPSEASCEASPQELGTPPTIGVVLASSDLYPVARAEAGDQTVIWIGLDEDACCSSETPHVYISRSKLAALGETLDIGRWMGIEVDVNLIQDAYDEFSAF